MKKAFVLALLLVLIFAGCGEDTQSDIFALPEMPETQGALLETVEQVRLEGFEYAEPRSGFNRYPVQLVDLDGDGEDEGIVFLRNVVDSYKTYIYIFEQSQSVFTLFDVIEGNENEIYTVSYSKMLEGEGYELIVKWGTDDERSHDVTAYSLGYDGMEKTLDIEANQFSVSDISGDGKNELLAVTKRDGRAWADIYSEEDEKIRKIGSVELSKHEGKVIRILSGKVFGEVSGAFIERESDKGIITDIVICEDGKYINLLANGDICGVSALCTDVNDDGTIELPKETEDDGKTSTDRTYFWRSADKSGVLLTRAFTYHSFSDNWYFSMPVSWGKTVFVKRVPIGTQRVKISFFTREKIGTADEEIYVEAPLFNIYVLKDGSKKAFASDQSKVIISERENVTFAGEIIATEYLGYTIDADFFKTAFKNRKSDWASEILFA